MTNIFLVTIKFFLRTPKKNSHQIFGHWIWWPLVTDFLGIAWKIQAVTEFFWAITIFFFPFVRSMVTIDWMTNFFQISTIVIESWRSKIGHHNGLDWKFSIAKKMVNIQMHSSICMCLDGHWCDNRHNVFASRQFWQSWLIVCLIAYVRIPIYLDQCL